MEVREMAIARPLVSEEEFMRLPDDGRKYELVDGEVKEVPANVEHDVIGVTVAVTLRPHAKGLGYVASSQAGFRMRSGNIRCPDVSFTRKDRFPDGLPPKTFGAIAPDLAIEIISQSEDGRDMVRKVGEYFESGAQQVWHMYPESSQIEVFYSPTDSRTFEADQEIDCPNILPGFRCRVSELFELE
jgi:Uma2 family endonuclease